MDYYNRERYVWDLARLSPDEYYKYYTTGVYPIPGIKPPKVSSDTLTHAQTPDCFPC